MKALDPVKIFIPFALSQKAASLVVASSFTEAQKVVNELKQNGFTLLTDPSLFSQKKHCLLVTMRNAKGAYDLAMQYGTGQVILHDKKYSQPRWVTPAYGENALILIVAKDELLAIEAAGFPLRAITGISVQP